MVKVTMNVVNMMELVADHAIMTGRGVDYQIDPYTSEWSYQFKIDGTWQECHVIEQKDWKETTLYIGKWAWSFGELKSSKDGLKVGMRLF